MVVELLKIALLFYGMCVHENEAQYKTVNENLETCIRSRELVSGPFPKAHGFPQAFLSILVYKKFCFGGA